MAKGRIPPVYIKAAAGTILTLGAGWGVQMILPSTLHNGISIIVLALSISGAIWLFTLSLKRRVRKMVFYFGIVFIILGFGLVVSQLNFHSEETKSEIHTQLDSLITDITEYSKGVPSMPRPTYSKDPNERDELWSEYTQKLTDYYSRLNSDFFNRFNTRIADTMIKLHDLHIVTDIEFEQDKHLYNFMPTAYNTYASSLLEKLNIYKARLDNLEKTLSTK